MRILFFTFFIITAYISNAQQGFAFTRISTEDGLGLLSNVVSSLHQDEKGFMWVGTANGLQRFDGRKFVQFSTGNGLRDARVDQIIAADSGKLILSVESFKEFGLFNPKNFSYQKIPLRTSKPVPARTDFYLWKDKKGAIILNVLGIGILVYDQQQNAFVQKNPYKVPAGWTVALNGFYEDEKKAQVWMACDSGLCIYDRATKQTWNRRYNPQRIAVLENDSLQDRLTQVHIDKQRRLWVFGWPAWGNGAQYKFAFDSTGKMLPAKDTIGLHTGLRGYAEYNHFYETAEGTLWIYGLGVLLNREKNANLFRQNRSETGYSDLAIDYDAVHQIMQDKDGGLWIATDRGLYFASFGNGSFSTVNLLFSNKKEEISFTDILEMPNGDFWFACWGSGIKVLDKNFVPVKYNVYAQPPPANWNANAVRGTQMPWSLCRQSSTGAVWVGCNGGILLVHDPQKNTTQYLRPEVFQNSTIRYITEDKKGVLWFGTQGGKLIKWNGREYKEVLNLGTIIYKIFIDKQGWIWLATHEKGLYAIDPINNKILQHYSTQTPARLFANTGSDIEQLNDSVIVYGAGALNFIYKNSGKVKMIAYEHGLPSNTVNRLRMDERGFLWIITANGLCRYNPANNRTTPYGRKDGIVLAERTNIADYKASNNQLIFAGSNAVIMFDPATFASTQRPPNVTITDFKLFNEFLPVDSLLQHPQIKLVHDQNSLSIYFASLSYMQRDKLTYYYKMEGIDKEWISADRLNFANYPLLPPGKYRFKIYCENIEGLRSENITEVAIFIKPPFWQTAWFISTLLFIIAIIVYAIHDLRVKRLLAVEKLRSRVARDLHDDMGSTLSTINILSSMAKTKMNTDVVKTTEYLSKISDNSQRMMEAMDDIVWSIKPANDSMQKITARMRAFATNVLEAKDMELLFEVSEEVHDVKLNMEARRDFFLVFKEAVNNAAKYSKADKVSIALKQAGRKLVLTISDDGCGFDVAAADNGNGLGNMQKRADNMNGKVRFQSAVGKGTTVIIEVPLVQKLKS